MYKIEIKSSFRRDTKKLSFDLEVAISSVLKSLRDNPFNPNLKIKKLRGKKNIFRAKISSHRLVFRIEKKNIELLHFAARDKIYTKKHFDLFML